MTDTIGQNVKKNTAEAYASPSWWYDIRGCFILLISYRDTPLPVIAFFARNLGARHLEIAFGSGTLFELILKRSIRRNKMIPHVVGIDYAPMMLAGARKRFAGNPNITLQQADATNLDLADNSFDTVNIANALHTIHNPDAVLREIYRVLKPGKTMAANALLHPRGPRLLRQWAERVNAWGKRKGILVDSFELEDIRNRIQQVGFTIAEEYVRGNTYNVIVRKPA